MTLSPPFPYYGGKRKWAADIWARFGNPDFYAEPFAGSLSVLLYRSTPCRREIVTDTNGLLCNFWRALQADPDAVAYYADYPTVHQDLTARHGWLRTWGLENREQLESDPEFFDVKAAGWWVWGISLWIGADWCRLEQIDFDGKKVPQFGPEPGGRGSNAQRIDIPYDARPYFNNTGGGHGVSAQRLFVPANKRPVMATSLGGKGISAHRTDLQGSGRLHPWFLKLAQRLYGVIVLNRSWESAVTPTAMGDTPSRPVRTRAILLDPPYITSDRRELYSSDYDGTSDAVAAATYEWAVQKGADPTYRIAYCCHTGDFPCPEGWSTLTKSFTGVRLSERKQKKADCLFFSPGCLDPAEQGRLFA